MKRIVGDVLVWLAQAAVLAAIALYVVVYAAATIEDIAVPFWRAVLG